MRSRALGNGTPCQFLQFFHLLEPSGPGDDRSRGDDRILLRLSSHLQIETRAFDVFLDERLLGKLVEQAPCGLPELKGVVESPPVQPSEQLVQIVPELAVQLVILEHARKGGLDDHPFGRCNMLGHLEDGPVGYGLAVPDTRFHPRTDHISVSDHAGGDYRAEKIALSTLVQSGMRLEPFRVVHFFVAKQKFTGDLGLENVGHEIFGPPALNDEFSAFVGDDLHLISVKGMTGILYFPRRPTS